MDATRVVDGRFELEAEIGSGGMGTVYRARDRAHDGNLVAFKIHTASSSLSLQRFGRESHLLAGLAHPNVVRYVAHGTMPDGRLYVAMEWVHGETLAQRLDTRGVSAAEAVRIVSQIASGLAYMHERGVLHRDLTPSNVMLVGDDAKIIDFGLARDMKSSQKLTETGAVMGTPGYMSPEQVLGDKLDVRSDIFTLGCILYECLCGLPAFTGPSWVAVQTKILLKPVTPLTEHGVTVPRALSELLDATLTKDLGSRVPSAAVLHDRLLAIGAVDDRTRYTSIGPSSATIQGAPPWRFPAQSHYLVIALTDGEVDRDAVNSHIRFLGGIVMHLAEGALIIRIEAARDNAAKRAARCALALRVLSATWPITIVDSDETRLDDATRELAADEIGVVFGKRAAAIRIDEGLAGQLGQEFEVARDRMGYLLVRARRPL